MRRALLTAAISLAAFPLGSCVPRNLSGLLSLAALGSSSSSDLSSALAKATGDLEKRCDELRQQDVAVGEEVGLGGAVAVSWMQTGGGLRYDTFNGDYPPSEEALSKPRNVLNVYIDTVGKNLAMQSSRPLLDWTFGVLDSPHFNAFSAPGGYVMVTRGLLQQVSNEAQLAGVLAHEISHITQRHALAAYERIRVDQCERAAGLAKGLGLVSALSGVDIDQILTKEIGAAGMSFLHTLGVAGFDLDLPANFELLASLTDGLMSTLRDDGFDQQQELEADQLAVELMTRAGYNPEEYIAFLDKIPTGGSGNVSHHPSTGDRKAKLRAYVKVLAKDPFLAAKERPFSDYAVVALTDELAAAR